MDHQVGVLDDSAKRWLLHPIVPRDHEETFRVRCRLFFFVFYDCGAALVNYLISLIE